MRIGFHYHVPAFYQEDSIWMPAYFGLFIDSLASHCETITCFFNSPIKEEITQMDYAIKSPNVQLVNIGPHIRVPFRFLNTLRMIKKIRKWQNELDILFMRAPTPLLPIFARIWGKPTVLLLVADDVAGIDNLHQPIWRKTLIRWWILYNFSEQMRLSKESLVFVNSQILFDKYKQVIPNIIQTQTTTLSKTDFFFKDDTCISPPYHLLYAGRMSRMKGLFDIVNALFNLVSTGFDVILDLVGMADNNDPIMDSLIKFSNSLGVGDRVRYHGYKTAGPELLAFYRQADIYVIASQSSAEGFPRTIWEAMASSTPVVATNVSSISAFIKDSAIIVSPNDVDGLTNAIQELLTNSELRKSLIRKGMILAQNNTLEKRSDELMTLINNWYNTRGDL